MAMALRNASFLAAPPRLSSPLEQQQQQQLNKNNNYNYKSPSAARRAPACRISYPGTCRSHIKFMAIRVTASSSSSSSSSNNNNSSSSSSSNNGGDAKKGAAGVPSSNYVVPLDTTPSCITRPLAEILRDLNKRIPDNILKPHSKIIPWYHANRMLSFYAPGWCGEVRDVIFADDGSVTVVYRVTIRGSDGEAHRESTGTILSSDPSSIDPVAAAEEIAFVRACARFGLGLYLYHEE